MPRPQETRTPGARGLAKQFRVLGDYIAISSNPQLALQRLANLARRTIDGCDWAAITQTYPYPTTLAASDDMARAIDLLQLSAGEGPCLTASSENQAIHVTDLELERRWPIFVHKALVETPVRSVLAFELAPDGDRTSLNLYAGKPNAFTPESISTAALFVSHAQLAIMHLRAAAKSANLERALSTSRMIGIAIGILMSENHITEKQAFGMLRESSQRLNRKLRDVADEVTETGELP